MLSYQFIFILLALILFIAFILLLISWDLAKRNNHGKWLKNMSILVIIICSILIIITLFKFDKLTKTHRVSKKIKENTEIHQDQKNCVFGIDVSHYNGLIEWDLVKTSQHPIKFVFIRATMGINGIDNYFQHNIEKAETQGFLVGCYHYYRPDENPVMQFENFKKHAIIKKGHLLPVLDIEDTGILKKNELVNNIKKWLKIAEKEFGVKPIVYTGRKFYFDYLYETIEDHPLWIASYSNKNKLKNINYSFHQFTEHTRVKGIEGYVDGNDFNGNLNDLKSNYVIK